MAIVATTLSAACTANDISVIVASTTGITAPNYQTGSGITVLLIDQEYMRVVGVNTTTKVVSVVRGHNGSASVAHVSGGQVQVGGPSDFPLVNEQLVAATVSSWTQAAVNQPAVFLSGSADAIDATKPGFYVVKTAGVDAMTIAVPPASAEGNIISIWSDTTNAHTLTAPSAIFAVGVALKTVGTFTAFRGCGVTLRVCNGVYHLLGGSGPTASSFVVWS